MAELPDFSEAAVKRAVRNSSLQHPSVVYPAALGVIGGLGALVVSASPVLVGAALTAGALALAGFGVNYYMRRDRLAGEYLRRLHESLIGQRAASLEELERSLKTLGYPEGLKQLERFVDKIEVFQAVLKEKLSPQEITFGRFAGIAEEVFLAGIENLRTIAIALTALKAIDETYIRGRIAALQKRKEPPAATAPEFDGLNAQLAQAASLRDKMEHCLGENEQALAQMDRTIAAIGDMKVGSGRATMDMESAMAELARIAKRAHEYT